MGRTWRFCILLFAVIGLLLQVNAFVSKTYGENLTPQQKLAIVLEGIQAPSQLSEVCEKYGISEATYQDWKSTLLFSADQIFGTPTERAVDVLGEDEFAVRPSTKIIGLGSDVFTEEITDLTEDKWKIQTSFKLWAASYTKRNFFLNIIGDEEQDKFKDTKLLGGAAISFSKGKHSISLSAIGPFSNWDDTRGNISFLGSILPSNSDGAADYYFGDIRYHTSVSENLSWFLGYKVGYHSWDEEFYADGIKFYEEDGESITHGPIFGVNTSFPISRSVPVSVWGSIAYGPIIIDHRDVDRIFLTDIDDQLFITEDKAGTNFGGWYLNPEVGIRTKITNNISFNLSYRSDIWGDYQKGPEASVGGPAASFSIKW